MSAPRACSADELKFMPSVCPHYEGLLPTECDHCVDHAVNIVAKLAELEDRGVLTKAEERARGEKELVAGRVTDKTLERLLEMVSFDVEMYRHESYISTIVLRALCQELMERRK